MIAGDVDGDGHADLLIGDPFNNTYIEDNNPPIPGGGTIHALLSSPGGPKGSPFLLFDTRDDWSWFGFVMKTISWKDANYLIVSQPLYHNGTDSAVGKITCLELSSRKAVWEVTGEFINARFGFSFDVDDHGKFLAVSAPTATTNQYPYQNGRVYILSLESLFSNRSSVNPKHFDITKSVSVQKLEKIASFDGNTTYSRLGWSLRFLPNDTTLLSSEPYLSDLGGVHVISLSQRSSDFESSCFTTKEKLSLFGKSVLPLDLDNDGNFDILISSPRSGAKFTNGGSVSVVFSEAGKE